MTMRSSTVLRDPIVEEIREIKRRLAEKFSYDVRAMLEDTRKRQKRGKTAAPSKMKKAK